MLPKLLGFPQYSEDFFFFGGGGGGGGGGWGWTQLIQNTFVFLSE